MSASFSPALRERIVKAVMGALDTPMKVRVYRNKRELRSAHYRSLKTNQTYAAGSFLIQSEPFPFSCPGPVELRFYDLSRKLLFSMEHGGHVVVGDTISLRIPLVFS